MSKKRKKQLFRGKFYSSYPNGGHPSLIYRKNRRKNQFDAVVFGTTPGHHRTLLKHPISNSITTTVVHNRPVRGARKDFGDKELTNLKINKEDKPTIETVKRRKPQETKEYKENTYNKKRDDPQRDAIPRRKYLTKHLLKKQEFIYQYRFKKKRRKCVYSNSNAPVYN